MPTPLGDTLPSLSVRRSSVHIDNPRFLPLHRNDLLAAQSNAQELDELSSTGKRHSTPDPQRRTRSPNLNIRVPQQGESSRPLLEQDQVSDEEEEQMGTRSRRGNHKEANGRPSLSIQTENGHAANGQANGSMNGNVEYRRKHQQSLESDAITSNLMSRESFSLDEPVPQTPVANNHGFFDLPLQDRKNFILLVLLYFLQGVPMGLATGSVPFLMKEKMSYGAIGIFSLASYPYSLKLLWSPIVDAVWTPKLGRRKSWIMPIQMLSGMGMIWLGGRVKMMMDGAAADTDGSGVWHFTAWWFFLVFMCATQDIAVDGWALTLLSPGNLSYASTAQTVGLTGGQFMSYTVFLAFNSKDFANKWFRAVPSEAPIMTLGGYLVFWGWVYMIVTIGLGLFKREERTKNEDGIFDVYKTMWGILKLRNIQTIIVIHLIAKIGFQANDAVTNLKLLEKGFSKEDMALTVLIDFPFELGLGYYAGKWSQVYTPLRLWSWAFVGRLVAALLAQITVIIFPKDGVDTWYLLVVIAEHIFSTFTNTVMFVAVSAFHARIADPVIGGTYMTLLATVSNLGGTFPRFFVLKLVDAFTVATCMPPAAPPLDEKLTSPLITEMFSCALQAERDRCKKGGGTCVTSRDGYYIMNILCVMVGAITFWSFIKPAALKLQALPLRAWRLGGNAVQ